MWRLGLSIVALSVLTQPGLQRFEAVEPHMGTLVRVTVYTSNADSARAAFRAAFDRISALDDILSDYKPDSELNRLARNAVDRPVRVSDDLFVVLEASQQLAEQTGGAFDVTLGPVIRLWRDARTTRRLPDPAALREASARTGFRKLHLDASTRTATLDISGMSLDLGGIGKGYAAEAAIQVLRAAGVRSALVAASGDLAFSDAPPGQRGWRIGIHGDDPALAAVPGVLELTNGAVSTSGNANQHLDIDGGRYSHIIDPASKAGVLEDITVTVIARRGLDADGLATAVSVLGVDRGLALIEEHPDTAALVVTRSREGVTPRTSSRFRELAGSPVRLH